MLLRHHRPCQPCCYPDGECRRTVKDVKFKDGKNDSLEQCLKKLMRQLKFAVTRDGKEASATVTILVKP